MACPVPRKAFFIPKILVAQRQLGNEQNLRGHSQVRVMFRKTVRLSQRKKFSLGPRFNWI